MTELSHVETEELVAHAHNLSSDIREGAQAIEKAWLLLGHKLFEFERIEGWLHDGSVCESFRAWCGQPGCPVSYQYARQLIQVYRTYCVNFAVPVENLTNAPVRGLLETRKAVEAGKVEPEQAIADAEALSESDLRALYSGDQRNDDGGPVLVRCPSCKSLVPEDRVNSHE